MLVCPIDEEMITSSRSIVTFLLLNHTFISSLEIFFHTKLQKFSFYLIVFLSRHILFLRFDHHSSRTLFHLPLHQAGKICSKSYNKEPKLEKLRLCISPALSSSNMSSSLQYSYEIIDTLELIFQSTFHSTEIFSWQKS